MIERVKSLEDSLSGQQQLKDSMTQLEQLVNNRDQDNGTLSDNLASTQADDNKGALGQTLEGVSNNDLKAAAMLIAFSQLRDSLNRQAPFENDLSLLQKLAGQDDTKLQVALERLAPHADNGVLTTSGLSQEFKGLAGDIVFSSLNGEEISFSEKAKARIHNMLKVEKDGELVTGTDTQAAVNEAQKMLDQGNIEGAIAELQRLDGEAAETALPFMEKAQASLMAQQAKKILGDNIISQITSKLPASPSNDMTHTLKTSQGESLNIESVKEALEDTIPTNSTVLTDKESGLSILPRQSGFKGFSDGE